MIDRILEGSSIPAIGVLLGELAGQNLGTQVDGIAPEILGVDLKRTTCPRRRPSMIAQRDETSLWKELSSFITSFALTLGILSPLFRGQVDPPRHLIDTSPPMVGSSCLGLDRFGVLPERRITEGHGVMMGLTSAPAHEVSAMAMAWRETTSSWNSHPR